MLYSVFSSCSQLSEWDWIQATSEQVHEVMHLSIPSHWPQASVSQFLQQCGTHTTAGFHHNIDRKGRFKRSTQELSKKGLNTLFSLEKYMSNQHVPVDLSCKLFDSLTRPIILYNSEIWFMEEYFSVLKPRTALGSMELAVIFYHW